VFIWDWKVAWLSLFTPANLENLFNVEIFPVCFYNIYEKFMNQSALTEIIQSRASRPQSQPDAPTISHPTIVAVALEALSLVGLLALSALAAPYTRGLSINFATTYIMHRGEPAAALKEMRAAASEIANAPHLSNLKEVVNTVARRTMLFSTIFALFPLGIGMGFSVYFINNLGIAWQAGRIAGVFSSLSGVLGAAASCIKNIEKCRQIWSRNTNALHAKLKVTQENKKEYERQLYRTFAEELTPGVFLSDQQLRSFPPFSLRSYFENNLRYFSDEEIGKFITKFPTIFTTQYLLKHLNAEQVKDIFLPRIPTLPSKEEIEALITETENISAETDNIKLCQLSTDIALYLQKIERLKTFLLEFSPIDDNLLLLSERMNINPANIRTLSQRVLPLDEESFLDEVATIEHREAQLSIKNLWAKRDKIESTFTELVDTKKKIDPALAEIHKDQGTDPASYVIVMKMSDLPDEAIEVMEAFKKLAGNNCLTNDEIASILKGKGIETRQDLIKEGLLDPRNADNAEFLYKIALFLQGKKEIKQSLSLCKKVALYAIQFFDRILKGSQLALIAATNPVYFGVGMLAGLIPSRPQTANSLSSLWDRNPRTVPTFVWQCQILSAQFIETFSSLFFNRCGVGYMGWKSGRALRFYACEICI
jgi:hypothetical protein